MSNLVGQACLRVCVQPGQSRDVGRNDKWCDPRRGKPAAKGKVTPRDEKRHRHAQQCRKNRRARRYLDGMHKRHRNRARRDRVPRPARTRRPGECGTDELKKRISDEKEGDEKQTSRPKTIQRTFDESSFVSKRRIYE